MAIPVEFLDTAERWLTILIAVAKAALAVRLVREGLHRAYPFFCLWLGAEVARAVALSLIRPRSTLYGYVFFFTEPVIWIFYFLIIRELYSLVLAGHRGLASAGQRTMMVAMVAALTIVGISLRGDLSNPDQPFPLLMLIHVAGRAVVSTLGVFLLLVTLVLAWFPIPLSRNTVYYCTGYAIFFCAKALLLLGRNVIGPEVAQYFSLANQAVAFGCILFWLARLSSAGQQTAARGKGGRWSAAEAGRLMGQLRRINEALSSGHKERPAGASDMSKELRNN